MVRNLEESYTPLFGSLGLSELLGKRITSLQKQPLVILCFLYNSSFAKTYGVFCHSILLTKNNNINAL